MKKFIGLALFALLIPFTVHADEQISDTEKALISTLLKQTGQASADVGAQFAGLFIQQTTAMLKRSKPDADPRTFEIVEEEINALIRESVVDNAAFDEMMYPIYARHFNESELAEMIELNKTELGQKIIRVMPLLAQEGMQAGQLFGESLGPIIRERISARLDAEGIK